MTINDLIRIRKDLYQEYESKFTQSLNFYMYENAKFKIGDIVVIKSRGELGVIDSIYTNIRSFDDFRSSVDPSYSFIKYRVRTLTKKLKPRKDGLVMTWGENQLEFKQQSK